MTYMKRGIIPEEREDAFEKGEIKESDRREYSRDERIGSSSETSSSSSVGDSENESEEEETR